MISLKKDLFVHLSLSAKALKEEELRQRKLAPKKTLLSNLERTSYESVKPIKVVPIKTMDETIEDVVDNPKIKELKKELAAVEEIFESLKNSGENLDFIYRIENKIGQLRKMIDQKSYF
jgi:hypothetical protein